MKDRRSKDTSKGAFFIWKKKCRGKNQSSRSLSAFLASIISLGIQILAFFDLVPFFATIQSELPVIYR